MHPSLCSQLATATLADRRARADRTVTTPSWRARSTRVLGELGWLLVDIGLRIATTPAPARRSTT